MGTYVVQVQTFYTATPKVGITSTLSTGNAMTSDKHYLWHLAGAIEWRRASVACGAGEIYMYMLGTAYGDGQLHRVHNGNSSNNGGPKYNSVAQQGRRRSIGGGSGGYYAY